MAFFGLNLNNLFKNILNETRLTKDIYEELKENLLEGMAKDRVSRDLFKEYFFEKADFEEFQERPIATRLPDYSENQPIEQYISKTHDFFTTNIKEISRIRSKIKNPNKKIRAEIKINTPSSIKSIIMGQATGIKRWDIKKYMLKKQGFASRVVPLNQNTGNPRFATMSINSKGWFYPAKQGVIPPTDVVYQDKQILIVETTVERLEQALEKMGRFGRIIIKY